VSLLFALWVVENFECYICTDFYNFIDNFWHHKNGFNWWVIWKLSSSYWCVPNATIIVACYILIKRRDEPIPREPALVRNLLREAHMHQLFFWGENTHTYSLVQPVIILAYGFNKQTGSNLMIIMQELGVWWVEETFGSLTLIVQRNTWFS